MLNYQTKILGLNEVWQTCLEELRTDENTYKFSLSLDKQMSKMSMQKVLKPC